MNQRFHRRRQILRDCLKPRAILIDRTYVSVAERR